MNASRRQASASSPRAFSTTTPTHTSLVLIIPMLIPCAASAPNMVRATPVCVRIPTPSTNSTATSASPTGEPIKKTHLESKKAVRGRRALRAVHAAFALAQPRKGAGEQPGTEFRPRPNPLVVAGAKDREAAIARLEGMEDVLVSGAHLNTEQSRVTIHDLPDVPGNCSKVFNAVATGGILVDMIVQNQSGPGKAELSFTVPRADLTRALKRTQDVIREIDPKCRVIGDGDIAVLFVLGVGMRTHTGVARTMFGALAERGINISMINTSEVCVSVVIEKSRGEEALACLREAFRIG